MDNQLVIDIIPDQVKEIKAVAPSKFEYLGSIKIKRGHCLFSFNWVTKELKKVEIKPKVAVDMNGKPVKTKEVIQELNCYYLSALNIKNARKKIVKLIKNFNS